MCARPSVCAQPGVYACPCMCASAAYACLCVCVLTYMCLGHACVSGCVCMSLYMRLACVCVSVYMCLGHVRVSGCRWHSPTVAFSSFLFSLLTLFGAAQGTHPKSLLWVARED